MPAAGKSEVLKRVLAAATGRCCLLQDLDRARFAGAAASCNTQAVLQLLDARGAELRSLANLMVRYRITDANIHGLFQIQCCNANHSHLYSYPCQVSVAG